MNTPFIGITKRGRIYICKSLQRLFKHRVRVLVSQEFVMLLPTKRDGYYTYRGIISMPPIGQKIGAVAGDKLPAYRNSGYTGRFSDRTGLGTGQPCVIVPLGAKANA